MIRNAVPADMPRIRELHALTEKKIGMKMDLPDVTDPAILGYWVCEDAQRGVFGAWYEEKCIEHCQIGDVTGASGEIWKHREAVFAGARDAGARFVHSLVPPQLDTWLGRMVFRMMYWWMSKTSRLIGYYLQRAGFRHTGMVHYSRRLR